MDTNTHRTATVTAAEQIQEWVDLLTYTTRGPWGSHPAPNKRRRVTDSNGATLFFTERDGQKCARRDADFIAASRTAVPAMTAALQAVLAIHKSDVLSRCIGCVDVEDQGWTEWPCPTVTAINEALEDTA